MFPSRSFSHFKCFAISLCKQLLTSILAAYLDSSFSFLLTRLLLLQFKDQRTQTRRGEWLNPFQTKRDIQLFWKWGKFCLRQRVDYFSCLRKTESFFTGRLWQQNRQCYLRDVKQNDFVWNIFKSLSFPHFIVPRQTKLFIQMRTSERWNFLSRKSFGSRAPQTEKLVSILGARNISPHTARVHITF